MSSHDGEVFVIKLTCVGCKEIESMRSKKKVVIKSIIGNLMSILGWIKISTCYWTFSPFHIPVLLSLFACSPGGNLTLNVVSCFSQLLFFVMSVYWVPSLQRSSVMFYTTYVLSESINLVLYSGTASLGWAVSTLHSVILCHYGGLLEGA